MKRPIDPNLENLTQDDFILDADTINSDNEMKFLHKPEEKKLDEPNFVVTHAEKSDNLADYHASEKHKQLAQSGELAYEEKEESHTHHHHHSSHSSHSHHHSSSHHHSHHHKKKKKKLSTAAKIAIAVLAIIFILIFAIVGTFFFLEAKGKKDIQTVIQDTPYEEIVEHNGHKYKYNKDIVTIAFIGVDKRDLGIENGIIGTAGQADADIIMTIDSSTGKATALAVPRDTMVDVDLYSENGIFLRSENMQLCLSYAYGDGKATSATNVTTSLSRILYNVPINKYFALDLNGIAPINDAIGGVTITSMQDFPNVDIKKGQSVHLIGDLTEAYVRTRELDNVEASLNRTARQVQYIKAFAAQLLPAVTSDFSVISKLYNTASDYSTTNISLSNATYLASLMLSKGITDFETQTVEGEMKASTNKQYQDFVYAEFYPDEDKLLETVLDIFYKQVD